MLTMYLQYDADEHYKHYFLAVAKERGAWCVKTAWGRIGTVFDERIYYGGKNGPNFASESNAASYAGAIARGKMRDGYTLEWCRDGREDIGMAWPTLANGSAYHGDEPEWWSDAIDDTSTPSIIKPTPVTKAAPPPPTTKASAKLAAMKATLRSRIESSDSDASVAVSSTLNEQKKEEEKPNAPKRKPRFEFR